MNRTYHKRGELIEGYRCREHPLYSVWAAMLARCTNPNEPSYKNYGGRGIAVTPRWHHFKNFVADMGPKPHGKLTLERRNNDLGYSKKNCIWASRTEQALNRRNFANNTSGERGVVKIRGRFVARYDYSGERYVIGSFADVRSAAAARRRFITAFKKDRSKAIASISRSRIWSTSSTRVRGVTVCTDGYMARCTINKIRYYIGCFATINEAKRERDRFIAQHSR